MKVYIVKEYSDGFNEHLRGHGSGSIVGVFAKYEDAEERAEHVAEHCSRGFETDVYSPEREKDIWYLNDMEIISIETHEVK